jgi:L-gulonolactone oxidase
MAARHAAGCHHSPTITGRRDGELAQLGRTSGGRPHWGKLHGLDAATLRTRYPRFDEFTPLWARLDPAGLLGSAHLDRVLGPVGG